MQTLIFSKSIVNFITHLPTADRLCTQIQGNTNFLRVCPQKCSNTLKNQCSRSVASHPSTFGGWEDFLLNDNSVPSGELNQLKNLLNLIGIGDKKYLCVFLFGIVCALAISRVKVHSIIVFPACAIVFAVGFSVGSVRRGSIKALKSNGTRRKITDETFISFAENLRNLRDKLSDHNSKVLRLKNDIKQRIDQKQVGLSDLQGYIDVLEPTDITLLNAVDPVESFIQSILSDNEDEDFDHDSSRGRKNLGSLWFSLSPLFCGLFGEKFYNSTPGKTKASGERESMDARKEENILACDMDERNSNHVLYGNMVNESATIFSNPSDCIGEGPTREEHYVNWAGAKNKVFEHQKTVLTEEKDTTKSAFNQTADSCRGDASNFVNNQQFHFKDYENEAMNFSIRMNYVESASSFGRQEKGENLDREYWCAESTEEDRRGYIRKNMVNTEKPNYLSNEETVHLNAFNSSPSSVFDDDLEFNRYFTEANNLLKVTKRCLSHQRADGCSENALYKCAVLLSRAIEIRPMSLLAVGQLGNTYLLHGELKLRVSREFRSLLIKIDPFSAIEGVEIPNRFDNQLADKEKIKIVLTDICEECEELLIKAGRKFRVALSIDGNDMKALYNWGLALLFRAQLIADIGPSGAPDADKMFMAAIDKFDAIMSKSNDCAPDALFRWGAALQHRSRLRSRSNREKVKLLQQAKRLYEDALHMDSENLQLQDALSSCVSELDYWYG